MALTGDFSGASSIGQATTISTPSDHATRLAAATYTGLDRTNVQSDTKVITVDTAANSTDDGEATWNTTSLIATKGPSRRLQIQDSTAGVAFDFVECIYSASAPASGFQIPGVLWRDMTLHMWRRYEDATTAPNGVAGWHPLDAAYELWKNETGTDTSANRVVIEKIDGTNNVRAFTETTNEKNERVLGVTMEAITNGSYGVVATVAGGATVNVFVLGSTFGAVAKGDALVCSTTSGKAREAGAIAGTATPSTTSTYIGLQKGAFAVAMASQASDDVVRCRLLGQVGRGMIVLHTPVTVWSDTSPPTSFTAFDVRKVSAADDGTQGAVTLEDDSHAPLVAWSGEMAVVGTDSTYSAWKLEFSRIGSTVCRTIRESSGDLSNNEYDERIPIPWTPCSTDAGNVPGNEIQVKYTAVSGTPSFSAYLLARSGYIC